MLLTVNPDTQYIVSASISGTPLSEISVPRASNVPIWVQFARDGVVYDPEVLETDIVSSSVASPTLITTDGAHGLSTGDSVTISGHTGAAKSITNSNVAPNYTATITIASPGVVTTAGSHGFSAGDPITFDTDGALPTGITAGVTYYVIAAGITATNFEFALTIGGTAIVTTGTQSGTHTVTGLKATIVCIGHGFSDGDTITIADHNGADPSIDGEYVIDNCTADTFTIPLAITTGSAGGTATRETSTPDLNGTYTITKVSDTTFTVAVAITNAGEGGTVSKTTALDLRWTVKSEGQYDQDPAIASIAPGSFTKFGTGSGTIFKGSCNYITNSLNAALGVEATTSLTVTITNASPAVCTTSAQTFIAGDRVTFTTTGTLPTGLTSGLEYYILSTGLTTTTFRVSLTDGGTAINTSSAGSGTHTATVARVANDVSDLDLIAELSWGGHLPGKTHTIDHTVTNDLYKTGESSPISTAIAYGRVAVGPGQSQVTVTFASALPSSSWRPSAMFVENIIDATPLNIFPGIVYAKSTTGFSVSLNAAVDSGNYYLQYECVP